MADCEPFLNVLPEPILLLFSTLLLLCVVKVEVFCKLDFPLPSNSIFDILLWKLCLQNPISHTHPTPILFFTFLNSDGKLD